MWKAKIILLVSLSGDEITTEVILMVMKLINYR